MRISNLAPTKGIQILYDGYDGCKVFREAIEHLLTNILQIHKQMTDVKITAV